jgi:hypothetical protein
MPDRKAPRWVAAIVVAAITVAMAGLYIGLRYAEVPSEAVLQVDPTKFLNYSGLFCGYSWENATSSGQGVAYTLNGGVRLDYVYLSSQAHYTIHVVANKKIAYAWLNGTPFRGVYGTFDRWLANVDGPGFDDLLCNPWWFPSRDYFTNISGQNVLDSNDKIAPILNPPSTTTQ